MSIFDNTTLHRLAAAKFKADEAYEDAWSRKQVELMHPDRFWPILDAFVKIVGNRDLNQRDASKNACDELYRRCVCGELQGVTFDDLIQFNANWNALSSELHTALFNTVTGKGDDSYGDLCDSLPLIGRENVTRLLNDGTLTNDDIVDIIENSRPIGTNKDVWREFVWEGENYFTMFLEDEARERFVHVARQSGPRPRIERLV